MLFYIAAPFVLALLYTLYWVGACALSAYLRTAKPRMVICGGMAALAVVPAWFLLDLVVEISAGFGHPMSGWVGLSVLSLLLAHPWIYPSVNASSRASDGADSFPRLRGESAAVEKILAVLCVILAVLSLAQVNNPFRRYADGVVTQRVPYFERRGTVKTDVTIAFTDSAGGKHSFTDKSGYVPHSAGKRIGVYYDPAAPARSAYPDLAGWEQVYTLHALLTAFAFGWIGLTGLAPKNGMAPQRTKPTRTGLSAHRLTPLLDAVKRDLKQAILAKGYSCDSLFYAGAYDIAPQHVFFGVHVKSDDERDRMNADAAIDKALHGFMEKHGYPAHVIRLIGVRAESQETVDRDYEGDWYRAWR